MNTEHLERACKIAEKQLGKLVDTAERDGKVSIQDAEFMDYLTHTIKSVKTTLAMEGYGSSERRGRSPYTGRYVSREGSYDGAYDDGSYADGSYRSYEGRSMHGDREKLERFMNETDDPSVKRALREAMHNI